VLKVLLEVIALGDRSRLLVGLILIFGALLILDVDLVQLNNTFLELLVIGDLLEALKNVIFEAFNIAVLLDDSLTDILGLFGQTIKSHAEISLNQLQVRADSVKMPDFLVHFGVLLMELLSVSLSGHDVLLHLFDLIIEHELEFLHLLSLLPEVVDPGAFFSESAVTLSNFFLLRINLLLALGDRRHLIVKLVLELSYGA